jgi:hypothetical protein
MYRIDADLKEFVESGVAAIVGTADLAGRPHVTYAWGPRVNEAGTGVALFIERARVGTTLANVRATGRIAFTVADPVSYRSVQLKGRLTDDGEADGADEAWVERHRESFSVSTALVGDPPETIRNLWMDDVVRLEFEVESAFDQTPGPGAGKPL